MKSTERDIKKLLARSSSWRFILFLLLFFSIFPISYFGRLYLLEPIWLQDKGMSPDLKQNQWLLFCKWNHCLEDIEPGDFTLIHLPHRNDIVRKLVAFPGDSIHLSAAGFFRAPLIELRYPTENIIIEDRKLRIPKKGDTLYFDSLNDIEIDYALNILRQEKTPFYVEALPFTDEELLPQELAGNTKIGSRPVGIRELQGLPWQELHLIANQIQMQIHSTEPVHFKRKIFSAKDSSQIHFLVVPENMYYILCSNGNRCADSRELGYIPESQIKGKLIYPQKTKAEKK